MLDEDCKPWLLEVNQQPSLKADSALDERIKFKLITDTLRLLNLSVRRKHKYIMTAKSEMK